MSKLGGLLLFVILIIVIFGLAAFSAEFFFGRPLMAFIEDLSFMVFHK